MINLKKHAGISIIFFLLAAALGVFLRGLYIFDISVTYRYIVHAHSHIALLGWVYIGLTTILYKLFLNKRDVHKRYRIIFWFTQITLVGMLVTFPVQGYALFSIIFSTLFLFASYWFTWFFIRNIPGKLKNTSSFKCIKFALLYMVISSIGPWALGIIMNTLGITSIWYKIAIYFYLHFQYNGWMILTLLGLLFFIFENKGVELSSKEFDRFFIIFNLGIIFTFFLSVLWTKPVLVYYLVAGLGGILQIIALTIFARIWKGLKSNEEAIFSSFHKHLLWTIGLLIIVKFLLQFLSAFPYFANLAATILEFTIGYLHWTFLGVISIAIFLFFDFFELIRLPRKGYFIYIVGFFLTELLIFYRGIVNWLGLSLFDNYYVLLMIASLFILAGLLYILINNFGLRSFKST